MYILMGLCPLCDIGICSDAQKASERICEVSAGLPQGSKKSTLSQKELIKVLYAVFVTCNENSPNEDSVAVDIIVMTEINDFDYQAHCKTQSQFKLLVKKHFIKKI